MHRPARRSRTARAAPSRRASGRARARHFDRPPSEPSPPAGPHEREHVARVLDDAFVRRLIDSGALANTLLVAIDGLGFWRTVLEARPARADAAKAERLFEAIRAARELHRLLRKLGLADALGRGRR
jgi:hypothetical protein